MLILNKTRINILVDVHFLIPTFQVVLIHINKVGNRINKVGHETTKWVNESTKWVNESTSWTAPNQPRGSRQLYADDTEGFELDWQIENGSLPDVMELVSKDLEGSVSTPGLGSLPPPNYYKERHEYTAVIELPHNITDIGNGSLVIDVDVVPDNQSKSHVELLTGEPTLEYNKILLNWSAAEEFCVSKGGHLASVASPFHWRKLQNFIRSKGIPWMWLGGTDEANEGNWTWTDGSKWSVEH